MESMHRPNPNVPPSAPPRSQWPDAFLELADTPLSGNSQPPADCRPAGPTVAHCPATSLQSAVAALTPTNLQTVLLPRSRAGTSDSWWGHVPFARLLIAELKPRSVVDLGLENGISFSAFCNAVKLVGLNSRCYAIEPWTREQCDTPNGRETVKPAVAFMRQHYASLAAFLAGPPELVADLFAPHTVDLIHIGALTEALLQTWLPKLSDRGVVLVHNTLDEKNLGSRQFWTKLRDRHPSFEFHHNGGLGVLSPGLAVPDF